MSRPRRRFNFSLALFGEGLASSGGWSIPGYLYKLTPERCTAVREIAGNARVSITIFDKMLAYDAASRRALIRAKVSVTSWIIASRVSSALCSFRRSASPTKRSSPRPARRSRPACSAFSFSDRRFGQPPTARVSPMLNLFILCYASTANQTGGLYMPMATSLQPSSSSRCDVRIPSPRRLLPPRDSGSHCEP